MSLPGEDALLDLRTWLDSLPASRTQLGHDEREMSIAINNSLLKNISLDFAATYNEAEISPTRGRGLEESPTVDWSIKMGGGGGEKEGFHGFCVSGSEGRNANVKRLEL